MTTIHRPICSLTLLAVLTLAGCGSTKTTTVAATSATTADAETQGKEVAKEVMRKAEGLPPRVAPLSHPVPMFPKPGETPRYPQSFREEILSGCDPHLGHSGTESRLFLCVCLIQRSEAKMGPAQLKEEQTSEGSVLRMVEKECAAEAVGR